MPIPFDKYDYLLMRDIERSPYILFSRSDGDERMKAEAWHREDNYRMLLIALDRYADAINKKQNAS